MNKYEFVANYNDNIICAKKELYKVSEVLDRVEVGIDECLKSTFENYNGNKGEYLFVVENNSVLYKDIYNLFYILEQQHKYTQYIPIELEKKHIEIIERCKNFKGDMFICGNEFHPFIKMIESHKYININETVFGMKMYEKNIVFYDNLYQEYMNGQNLKLNKKNLVIAHIYGLISLFLGIWGVWGEDIIKFISSVFK